jgi:ABC-type Fe3+-hydroxamate transport system substrate-binding protein
VRIVSLVPSVTETLVALGVPPVACTRFCDLDGVRTVGGTKKPDIAAIVALAPDLVVVNDEENRIEDAHALEAAGLRLHSMSPRAVAEVGPAIDALCAQIGIGAPVIPAVPSVPARGRAFVPIWRRPWMTFNAGTYGSSVLACIGVANVFADSDERYPEVTLADVATRAPDVVLLPDEPYAFGERHVAEVQDALPDARVVLVDGRDLFWWGTRTRDAVARLRAVLS